MDRLKMHTPNLADGNIAKIAALFPNAVTEVQKNGETKLAIDFDVLRQELSEDVVEGMQERYEFVWPGKKKSVVLANAPTAKTLRLDRAKSVGRDGTPGGIDSENIYIEGDNLDALKLLRKAYLGRVKMIYIDPPYNTGSDLIYKDDFTISGEAYEENRGQADAYGSCFLAGLQSDGRFHTDWLNMIYPRLRAARELLADEGIILISIDDHEQDNLKKICDEIFGSFNFIGTFVVNSTPNARDYGHIGKMHEYCFFYAKNIDSAVTFKLPDTNKAFKYSDEKGGYNIHPLYNSNEAFHKGNRPNLFYPFYLYLDQPEGRGFYRIGLERTDHSVEIYPPKSLKNGVQFVWRWGKEKALKNMNIEITGYETSPGEYRIVQKMRHSEKRIRSILSDTKYSSRRGTAEVEKIMGGKIFTFPKPVSLIYDFCKIGMDDGDIMVDFFSGSATSAQAVMQLNAQDNGNRKYIMIQWPEITPNQSEAQKAGYSTICEIGEERIRRAGQIIKQETGEDIDYGFRVFRVDAGNREDVYCEPEDLLFQVMLDLGILLSSRIEEEEIAGKKVFSVADGYLIACFDTDAAEETIKEIARRHPSYAVFSASGMAADSVIADYEQIFETYSPNTKRKVM